MTLWGRGKMVEPLLLFVFDLLKSAGFLWACYTSSCKYIFICLGTCVQWGPVIPHRGSYGKSFASSHPFSPRVDILYTFSQTTSYSCDTPKSIPATQPRPTWVGVMKRRSDTTLRMEWLSLAGVKMEVLMYLQQPVTKMCHQIGNGAGGRT